MGLRQLENAKQRLNEAIADAVPGINVDFTAEIVEIGYEKYSVALKAKTKKGGVYLPYLAEYIKHCMKGENGREN
jgi:hypothetical protein